MPNDPREAAIAVERAALAEKPPDTCPDCGNPAQAPAKDEYNRWTWHCLEGCNPLSIEVKASSDAVKEVIALVDKLYGTEYR
jgi:hypothetical protein